MRQIKQDYSLNFHVVVWPTHSAQSQDVALINSSNDRIKKGVSDANLNLYLKSNLWHKVGSAPKSYEHLTAYVYEDNVHVETCHIHSYKTKLFGPYVTTC